MRKSIITGSRRSGLEIIAELLEEARSGSTKTRLVRKTNLNFLVIRKHLEFLIKKELIEIVNEPFPLYVTTGKGKEFLEEFSRVKQMLGNGEIEKDQIYACM